MPQLDTSREEAPEEKTPKQQRPKEVAHDETPALITSHKFRPRGEWYSLCFYCGLGEAAHAEREIRYYSDDNPED